MKAVRFSLLVVDRKLGDGDGIELCREYRAQAPNGDTAILVLSSLDSAENMAEALAAGADDCMSKSCSEQEFLAKVEKLLAKSTPRVKPATMVDDAETRRLQALNTYDILDTEDEAIYDDITLLASRICNTPIALLSFIDEQRQWFKSKVGLAARQTPRDQAFCAYAITTPDEILMVNDARLDPRFADNPLVTGEPKIRFYAGAPIVAPDGNTLGALCVIDRQPREIDAVQQEGLQALSRQVMALLEARRTAATVRTTMQANIEAERLKDEFLTMVSHELRTPITALRGALGLLTAGVIADLPPKVHSLIALADRNADRLHRLVNDILDLKRIEAGAFDFRMAAVDVVELVAQAATELKPYADQYRVTLTVVAHSPQAIVLADADRLMQVLANLISNAIKFSPAGEQVEIHSTRIGNRVRISVTDRGGGITEEFRSRIFKKFAQADSTATNRKGAPGSG